MQTALTVLQWSGIVVGVLTLAYILRKPFIDALTPVEEETDFQKLERQAVYFMVECHEEVNELLVQITAIEDHWRVRCREVPEEDARRIACLSDRIQAAQFAYQATRALLHREREAHRLRMLRESADAAGCCPA
jgi:hypothetical protein